MNRKSCLVSSKMKFHRPLFAIIFCLAHGTAFGEPPNIRVGEISLLPSYCKHTQTFTTDDPRSRYIDSPAKSLYLTLGPSYLALHHYCWGLIYKRRAEQPGLPQNTRRAYYENSINEYGFLLANSASDFALRPEAYLRIGEAYIALQAYSDAIEPLMRSIAAKADYWPPYERWAAVLNRLGKREEALEKIEAGLRLMPEERSLIEPYKRYGGDYAKFLKTLPPRASAAAASVTQTGASSSLAARALAASAPAPADSSSP